MIKALSALLIVLMGAALLSYNPLAVCLGLILISLVVGSILSVKVSKWLMLSLVLLFLGGMMVVFIYTTALSGVQKLSFPQYVPQSILVVSLLLTSDHSSGTPAFTPLSVWQIFHEHSFVLLGTMVSLLFTALVVTVKLVEGFKGALKSFF